MKKILLASILALTSASSFAATNMGYDSVGVKVGMLDSSTHDPKAISLSVSKEMVAGMFGVASYTNTSFDGLQELEDGNGFQFGLGYHLHVAKPLDLYAHAGVANESFKAPGESIDETMGYARVGAKIIASEDILFDVSYGMNFGAEDAIAEKSDFAASVNYYISDEFSLGFEYAMIMHDKEMNIWGNGEDDTTSKLSLLATYSF